MHVYINIIFIIEQSLNSFLDRLNTNEAKATFYT